MYMFIYTFSSVFNTIPCALVDKQVLTPEQQVCAIPNSFIHSAKKSPEEKVNRPEFEALPSHSKTLSSLTASIGIHRSPLLAGERMDEGRRGRHPFTKCKEPLYKRKVVFLQGSVHFHGGRVANS